MLVKVRDSFKGFFGLPDKETGGIRAKRAGDPPFELDDCLASAHIEGGVLIQAGAAQEATQEATQEAPDWGQLKARAKELGINPVGKSKAALEQLIEEAGKGDGGGETLTLEAPDPVMEG